MNWASGFYWLALLGAAALSNLLIVLLRPLLQRYALARPNARSSHDMPTPQGGGIAVIGAIVLIIAAAAIFSPGSLTDQTRLAVVFVCVIALAIVGVTDDIRPLEAVPRLFLQTIIVLVVVATLPTDLRILPFLPSWLERVLMAVAMLWLVNLVNFMDGIDWMSVVEVVPLTAALGLFGLAGALPSDATLTAFALCGAMIGFAPFNKPVARVFLGDVGSLPIGLLLGWLLILLGEHHFAATILLPLYYAADATITLLRRLARHEPVMQAHRSHFYQRALDRGVDIFKIIKQVFLLNVALSALAAVTILTSSAVLQICAVVAGAILVGITLLYFAGTTKIHPSPGS